MASKITLRKSFQDGQGVGSSSYFSFDTDLDFNFTSIETMVFALIDEVSAVQGPNALLARETLEVNDPLHTGGIQFSGVIGEHSLKTAIGAPTTQLNVARGQLLINGSRVAAPADTVLTGSGSAGTRWVNVSGSAQVTLQTAANAVAGGLDIASVTWNGANFTGSVTQLARIFFDGDDYDLQRRRLAAVGGGTPAFPITTYRAVYERLQSIERFLAGVKTGAAGESLGALGIGGSAAVPGLITTDGSTFDLTTGLFRAAANALGISVSGAEVARWVATQLQAAITGSAATPWISRTADPDTGLYFPGGNEVALSAGGAQAATFRLLSAGAHAITAATNLRVRTSRTALALASGSALVALAMDTEDQDVGGWFAPTSADHTVPTNGDGVYMIQGGVRFDEASAGGTNQNTGNVRRVAITVGGTEVLGSGVLVPSRGNNALTDDTRLAAVAVLPLTAGQVVRLAAAQDSGASMNVDTALRIVKMW